MAHQDGGRRRANLVGCLEFAGSNPPLQLFQLALHTIHGLDALCSLEFQTFIGVNDEHANTRVIGGDFLDQGFRRG